MAEAVLEVALENLSSLIQNELGLFLGVDQDMERLSSTLTTIKATLEDAEEKQLTDRAIKNWLKKLKDAAHMLDDILDECATQALELEYEGLKCGQADKVQSSCLSSFHPKHVVFRHKIAKKMKKMREILDQIAEERNKFHLREMMVPERRTEVIDWRQTTSIITQPEIRGREEVRDEIVDFLVGDATNFEDLSVYPIVGMGGLGKTTLAQLIFNHERVVNHFDLRIWVCVSEDFSLKRLSKAIVESLSVNPPADLDLEPLQRRLQELLGRKRYLLVLDDVWNEDQEKWDKLKYVLACGAKGASILVTTRLTKVGSIVGTMPSHQLSMLSDSDCWEVFKQRAFGANEGERAELVVLGKEIVKKCSGVPLAAKALGSLLRFKREEKEWLYVKESKLWSLPQDENSIIPALRLSYLNLPVKLRQCFAYCALFPKDTYISKKFLIELWAANGFISSNEMLDVEDIGDQVWNELYWRSFFQDIKTDKYGKITRFNMHDLVHDLAQSVTEEVCCVTDDNGVTSLSDRIRHLSIHRHMSSDQLNSMQLHQVKSLKTFIVLEDSANSPFPQLLKCYSLRVLDLKDLMDLSSSVGHLIHLRYLNLSGGRFRTLPESLCRLWNLQILILDYCYGLRKLPNRLNRLKALQHLSLRYCTSLSSMPLEIGQLTSLRTLNVFIVGKERGFLLSELGRLNLKGELHIKHLEKVRSVMDAKEANLASKHLNKLLLSWDRNEESQLPKNDEQILEVLQPHTQQLKTLSVTGYRGVQFPQWMGSPYLHDLNFIELVDSESCLHLPPLGKLPSLKTLRIYKMNNVKYLDDGSYDGEFAGGFIALELLMLKKLPNLIRLSREDGENMFPHLSILEITECPNLGLPCLPSLNELMILGKCNQDLLSSIHKFRSLESLKFSGNEELTSFPDGMLQEVTSLKKVDIHSLSKLEVLLTESINLNALQELYINDCPSLKPLTEQVLQGLHSLKILHVDRYREFNLSAGFQYLTCLEDLRISSCPKVEGFPDALQHMTTLQSLNLFDLPNLGSLPDWLGNLGLLRFLSIYSCPKLMHLPMSIQCLGSLKFLRIYGCSELQKRCKKNTGEDWPKIAHVPNILF